MKWVCLYLETQSLIGDLASVSITSLNEVSPDGKVSDLCETLSADPGDTPLKYLLRWEVNKCLGMTLQKLTEREYQVLDMYYFSEMKMKESRNFDGSRRGQDFTDSFGRDYEIAHSHGGRR